MEGEETTSYAITPHTPIYEEEGISDGLSQIHNQSVKSGVNQAVKNLQPVTQIMTHQKRKSRTELSDYQIQGPQTNYNE